VEIQSYAISVIESSATILATTALAPPVWRQAVSSIIVAILFALIGLFFILLFLALYFIPFIIAFFRRHAYKWVILALNVAGVSGITWLIALVWAVWPTEKSLIDPIAGNVTGKGSRNAGDTIGSVEYGRRRGYDEETRR